MSTKSQTEREAASSPEYFTEMQTKGMEALTALCQANQRVVQELVELSASTVREGMRAYADLQSAVVEAARSAQTPQLDPREIIEELQRSPFTWYQKRLLTSVEGTQKAFELVEANAQIVTCSAERLQAQAERTGKEIRGALAAYMGRMRELYGRN